MTGLRAELNPSPTLPFSRGGSSVRAWKLYQIRPCLRICSTSSFASPALAACGSDS